jgi:hypothetical protein
MNILRYLNIEENSILSITFDTIKLQPFSNDLSLICNRRKTSEIQNCPSDKEYEHYTPFHNKDQNPHVVNT